MAAPGAGAAVRVVLQDGIGGGGGWGRGTILLGKVGTPLRCSLTAPHDAGSAAESPTSPHPTISGPPGRGPLLSRPGVGDARTAYCGALLAWAVTAPALPMVP